MNKNFERLVEKIPCEICVNSLIVGRARLPLRLISTCMFTNGSRNRESFLCDLRWYAKKPCTDTLIIVANNVPRRDYARAFAIVCDEFARTAKILSRIRFNRRSPVALRVLETKH